MKVTLTPHEAYVAGLVGYRRNLEAIFKNRTPRFPEKVPGELFGFHILAAQAEIAVAKALGVYWSPHINHFEGGDVGRIEVRYSQRPDVKVRERDDGVVVGVSGYCPEFLIVGFVAASYARSHYQPTAPREGPPAYFVPIADLTPIEVLIASIRNNTDNAPATTAESDQFGF